MVNFKVVKPPKGVIEKQIIEALKKSISQKIGNMQCPEHHRGATVEIAGSFDNPQIQIGGCCESFIKSVTEVLKS